MWLLCSMQCVIFPFFIPLHPLGCDGNRKHRISRTCISRGSYELHALLQLMENKCTNLSSSSFCRNCTSTRDNCPSFIIILELWKMRKMPEKDENICKVCRPILASFSFSYHICRLHWICNCIETKSKWSKTSALFSLSSARVTPSESKDPFSIFEVQLETSTT